MTRKEYLIKEGEKRYPKLLKSRRSKEGEIITPYVLKTMREKYIEQGILKLGYVDIESSGLSADFDFMITYAVLVRDILTRKTIIRHGRITVDDLERAKKEGDADRIDARLLEKLMEDISDIDCIIVHWGIGKHRHDIPFIRSRMAINQISGFPKHRMVRFGDTQRWSSQIHRLRNNGLGTIADAYGLSTHKTPVKTKDWKKASMFADKKAIDYILNHNIKDVIITYKVHKHIEDYVPLPSIYF